MTHHLIRTNGPMLPAGFEFQDRVTGKIYKDTHTLFDERVKQIIRDRLANRRLFTDETKVDATAVAKELSAYTCARLGNDPRFCTNGLPSSPKAAVAALPEAKKQTKICPACGSENVSEVYCKTCSSRRLTGYTCNVCKKAFPK